MKNLLRKFGMARLLAVAITAFACVCMWGCGLFDEEVTHEVHEKGTVGL